MRITRATDPKAQSARRDCAGRKGLNTLETSAFYTTVLQVEFGNHALKPFHPSLPRFDEYDRQLRAHDGDDETGEPRATAEIEP